MSEVTRNLSTIEGGDPCAAAQLLPLVYQELRSLAARQLAQERPGHTLDATALVHEAYLRLVSGAGRELGEAVFANRRHFFAAATQAMRRIVVENARRKSRLKRGGGRQREAVTLDALPDSMPDEELLALHDALDRLGAHDPVRPDSSNCGSSAACRCPR